MTEEIVEFYVCVFSRDGKKVGHAVSRKPEFPKTLQEVSLSKEERDDQAQSANSKFADLFDDFVKSMFGFIEFMPIIIDISRLVSNDLLLQALEGFLEKTKTKKTVDGDRAIFTVPIDKIEEFGRLSGMLMSGLETSRNIPRMLTAGLVSSFEYHLGLLMHEIASSNPDAIFDREKTLSVRELMKAASIDELKRSITNSEIDSVLRDGFDDQISWIEKRANLEKIEPKYPEWPDLVEVLERRNLFVHTGGNISEQYLRAARKYNFKDLKNLVLGKELHAGPKYFTRSVELVTDFGAKLIQVVWRKLKPDDAELADKRIARFGFELIERGQYELAKTILKFGSEIRGLSSDRIRRTMVVNLANANKLSKNSEEAKLVLDREDWTSTSNDFAICVAAIREDVVDVVSLMKKIGSSGEITAQDYQEWPAFFHVRDDENFRNAFKEIFSVDFVAAPKRKSGITQLMRSMRAAEAEAEVAAEAEVDDQKKPTRGSSSAQPPLLN